jgi:hypothetical protein
MYSISIADGNQKMQGLNRRKRVHEESNEGLQVENAAKVG